MSTAKTLVTFNLRLTASEKAIVDAEAKRRGVSRAGLIRSLLQSANLLSVPAAITASLAVCSHPKKDEKQMGWGVLCGACQTRVR